MSGYSPDLNRSWRLNSAPGEIPPVEDDVDQLGSSMAALSTEGSVLPKQLHEIERRWVPLGPSFSPNSVMAFLKKLPPAVTDVEGVSQVFLKPLLLALAISHHDTVQLPSVQTRSVTVVASPVS